jgi:hypothetical protein
VRRGGERLSAIPRVDCRERLRDRMRLGERLRDRMRLDCERERLRFGGILMFKKKSYKRTSTRLIHTYSFL